MREPINKNEAANNFFRGHNKYIFVCIWCEGLCGLRNTKCKETVHLKKCVIIYSPSCHFKPEWPPSVDHKIYFEQCFNCSCPYYEGQCSMLFWTPPTFNVWTKDDFLKISYSYLSNCLMHFIFLYQIKKIQMIWHNTQ